MDQQALRDLFERELDAEAAPPLGNVVRDAMKQGTRLRSRRRLAAGGVAAGVLAVVATAVLGIPVLRGAEAPPAPAMGSAECSMPAPGAPGAPSSGRGEVVVFLRYDLTDAERTRLTAELRDSPYVRSVQYESREEAYARFRELWRNSPDLVRTVRPGQLPTSFRVRLNDPAQYPGFAERIRKNDAIGDIVGGTDLPCPGPARRGEGK